MINILFCVFSADNTLRDGCGCWMRLWPEQWSHRPVFQKCRRLRYQREPAWKRPKENQLFQHNLQVNAQFRKILVIALILNEPFTRYALIISLFSTQKIVIGSCTVGGEHQLFPPVWKVSWGALEVPMGHHGDFKGIHRIRRVPWIGTYGYH